tara:strand:- start:2451 stop:2621 length:171 start_codon:yes stop_codon:yes gene_type:complete
MELKEMNLKGQMIPIVLSIITKKELPGKEYHFLYGQSEYTRNLKKVIKQFKRQFQK